MSNLDTWTLDPLQEKKLDGLGRSRTRNWPSGDQHFFRHTEHPLSNRLLKFLTLNRMEPGQPVCPGLSRWVGRGLPQ